MKTENKILKYLIETKNELTIRELANQIGADYKIIHTAIKRLINKNLLKSRKIGKSIQIGFNNKLGKKTLEVEFERREEILKNKNLRLMLDSIKKDISTSNFILLLFGSYAKKNETKNSDIDLIFIVSDEKIETKILDSISILPLKIHPLVFTEKQFVDMKNSHKLNVVKEAIRNNIILHGIEQYYELLNDDR